MHIYLIVFAAFLSLFTFQSLAQQKDCAIVVTNNSNKPLQSITFHGKTSEITLARQYTTYYLGFQKKGFYNLVRGGMAQYKLDSVGLRMGRKGLAFYKAEGVGISPEMLSEPKFWGTYFSIKLNASQWNYLKTKNIRHFYSYGENSSRGIDKIERCLSRKIKKGFDCLSN